MTVEDRTLRAAREAREGAKWPEQHRDDCAWCAHLAGIA